MTMTGTPDHDPYARIGLLYDLEHDEVLDDAELYCAMAEEIGGPVLELGCGSGRLLKPLAAAGHQVTGIDSSLPMLGRARARLSHSRNAARVTLHQGDMAAADAAPGGPFGMVLFSLNALMHLADPEVQLDALRAARRALRPGGQLVLDVLNPTPQYLVDIGRAPILEWSTTLDDGSSIDKWSVRVIHPVDQLIETTLWYDQVDTAGRVTRTRTAFVLRYVQAHELLLMLELAGFDAARVFGSTDLEPLTEASDRILAISGVPESPEIVDRGESQ